jgi:hypothetical protein
MEAPMDSPPAAAAGAAEEATFAVVFATAAAAGAAGGGGAGGGGGAAACAAAAAEGGGGGGGGAAAACCTPCIDDCTDDVDVCACEAAAPNDDPIWAPICADAAPADVAAGAVCCSAWFNACTWAVAAAVGAPEPKPPVAPGDDAGGGGGGASFFGGAVVEVPVPKAAGDPGCGAICEPGKSDAGRPVYTPGGSADLGPGAAMPAFCPSRPAPITAFLSAVAYIWENESPGWNGVDPGPATSALGIRPPVWVTTSPPPDG